MLASPPLCALCKTPTRVRCSRCKVIYYCSFECQGKHWKEGHRVECKRLTASGDAPLPTATSLLATQAKSHSHALCASHESLTKPKKVLFPYEYFVRFFHFNGLGLPCGLINCGNSCYANVILQCLTYTRPLAAYLLRQMHKHQCRRTGWCFLCELESHVIKASQSSVPFSPIKILSRLRNIGNSLGYGRQEDAHEFMRYAVDTMQKICLDEAGGESALDIRTQETTLIQHIFGGHLQSQVTCSQCFQESNRYDNILDLTVEIQGSVETLEDALKQFTAAEWLDGDNKYACDRCNAYVPARKRLSIHNAPNILTIALKRFQGGKFGKINKKVAFPEVLNMRPYMSGKGDKPPAYKLYALVVHVDMLNASYFGHYVCFLKDRQGAWFKVDDNKVKEVEAERVMSQKVYMLFYARSTVRPGPIVDDRTPSSSTTSTWETGVIETSNSLEANGNFGVDGEISSEKGEKQAPIAGTAVVPKAKKQKDQVESSDSSIDSGLPLSAGKRRLHQRASATASSSCNNQDASSPAIEDVQHHSPVSSASAPSRDELGVTGDDDVDVEEGSLLQSTLTSLAGESSNVVVSSTPPENATLPAKRPRTSDSSDAGPATKQQHPAEFSEDFKPMLKRGFLNRPVVALPQPRLM